MRSIVARQWEVDNDQLRAITQADPLTTTQEVAAELSVDHSTVIWHLKQTGKVKKLNKRVPHELTTNQKIRCFDMSPFIPPNNNKSFLDQIVTCNDWKVDFMHCVMTSSVLDWEGAPKHFPKPNLHQNKVMVTVWWSVAGLIHYSFLNPSKTIKSLSSMLSKSMRCTKNCNTCSQHWSTEWA